MPLLATAILLGSFTSCEKEGDEDKYTCKEAQEAADRYKREWSVTLSALKSGIISMEQAEEARRKSEAKAKAIIDNAECFVSLN